MSEDSGGRPTDADRPNPTRIVADADVLAADLLVDGAARDVLDAIRAHSWLTLVVSEPLLDDVRSVVTEIADADLAAAHRERLSALGEHVDHPAGDHPGLACALHGEAAHVLTFDESLTTAQAGANVKRFVTTSIKQPDAFRATFDPERLYPVVEEGTYPGPDRDPRA